MSAAGAVEIFDITHDFCCRHAGGGVCSTKLRASIAAACVAGWFVNEKDGAFAALCPEHAGSPEARHAVQKALHAGVVVKNP